MTLKLPGLEAFSVENAEAPRTSYVGARCRSLADHDWKPAPRGRHEVCAKCRDRFPCAKECSHLDCRAERGDPMPEWATMESPR